MPTSRPVLENVNKLPNFKKSTAREQVRGLCVPGHLHASHATNVPGVICVADRHYCKSCLVQRIKDDPSFIAEIVLELMNSKP